MPTPASPHDETETELQFSLSEQWIQEEHGTEEFNRYNDPGSSVNYRPETAISGRADDNDDPGTLNSVLTNVDEGKYVDSKPALGYYLDGMYYCDLTANEYSELSKQATSGIHKSTGPETNQPELESSAPLHEYNKIKKIDKKSPLALNNVEEVVPLHPLPINEPLISTCPIPNSDDLEASLVVVGLPPITYVMNQHHVIPTEYADVIKRIERNHEIYSSRESVHNTSHNSSHISAHNPVDIYVQNSAHISAHNPSNNSAHIYVNNSANISDYSSSQISVHDPTDISAHNPTDISVHISNTGPLLINSFAPIVSEDCYSSVPLVENKSRLGTKKKVKTTTPIVKRNIPVSERAAISVWPPTLMHTNSHNIWAATIDNRAYKQEVMAQPEASDQLEFRSFGFSRHVIDTQYLEEQPLDLVMRRPISQKVTPTAQVYNHFDYDDDEGACPPRDLSLNLGRSVSCQRHVRHHRRNTLLEQRDMYKACINLSEL